MHHRIEVDNKSKIIKVFAQGKWNIEDSDKITTVITEKSQETGIVKILIDHSQLKINVSNLVAYKRPLQLKSQFEDIYPFVAFVSPSGKHALYKFFVTVARNRGIFFNAFKDYDSALEWLLAN